MRKIQFYLVAILSISIIGCNKAKEAATESPMATTEHTHNPLHDIELENGEKWKVNEEMKPFITEGAALVDNYIQNGESDFAALAENVGVQNSQLVKSCTMKGKSHDELHKWLEPHLELVASLTKTTDSTKASQLINELRDSYQVYHQYFE